MGKSVCEGFWRQHTQCFLFVYYWSARSYEIDNLGALSDFAGVRARLTKDFCFEAAHHLPSLPEGHKCIKMHGHSFKVEVSIEGEVDPKIGWIYDHKCISDAMKPLLDEMDHSVLNDIEGLESPTIEVMCAWFWKKLEPDLPGLAEITIYETPTARCTFRGEF